MAGHKLNLGRSVGVSRPEGTGGSVPVLLGVLPPFRVAVNLLSEVCFSSGLA